MKKGTHHSAETKAKMAIIFKAGYSIGNRTAYWKNKKFSKKHRRKISKGCKGKNEGSKHYNWKLGKKIDTNGYILIKTPHHPYCNKCGYVFEHRLVMEKHINRFLYQEEVVHHINGIPSDNKIDNLKLFNNHSKHMSLHNTV